jgi:hypothetical protein
VSDGTQLVRYDAMCRAIAEAYEVDEVKDIRDKAVAIEVYARQAKNVEAERQACEIRLRAERKCGELLREREKAKRGPDKDTGQRSQRSTSVETLADLGITKDQSSQWQKLAGVPPDLFEQELQRERPTTNGIIAAAFAPTEPKNKVPDAALWLWGRLRDFEDDGLLALDPNEVVAGMLGHMRVTTQELAPRVAAWLGRIKT